MSSFNSTCIAVWGADTFVGSQLALQCLTEGSQVLLLESNVSQIYFPELQNCFRLQTENESAENIADVFESQKVCVVFFCFPEGLEKPLEFHQKLWKEFYLLLDVLAKKNSVGKIIVLSSDKVYPFVAPPEISQRVQELGYNENDQLSADDIFGAAFVGLENLIQSFNRSVTQKSAFGKTFQWGIVRSPNVVGPTDWRKNSFLWEVYQAVKKNEFLQIRKPSSQRFWLDVRDLASAMLLLSKNESIFKDELVPVFNVNNPKSSAAVGEIARRSVDILHREFNLRFDHVLTGEDSASFKAKNRCLDLRKAQGLDLLKDFHSLEETLTDSLRWYHNLSTEG